jgi:hypothetical protein
LKRAAMMTTRRCLASRRMVLVSEPVMGREVYGSYSAT